jgi:signal transduction histidine kinase
VETYLRRFLDLGKAVELQRRPCDMRDLLRDAVVLLGPQCRHAGIALRCHEAGMSLIVSGDTGQLGQLLSNVLSNAVEAAGPGGAVDLSLGKTDAGHVYLEVVDSGPGPPPHVVERLFEPFVTGKPEGVGLGLAVARQVAEAHGGTIRWFRKPEGTCFRIELPLTA